MSEKKDDIVRGNFVVDLILELNLNKDLDTYISDSNINVNTKKAIDKIIRTLIDELYQRDNAIQGLAEEVDYYEKEELYYQDPNGEYFN